jgi:hypothetical protein
MSTDRLYELRDPLDAIQNKRTKTAVDLIEASKIADELSEVATQQRRVEAKSTVIDDLGAPPDLGSGGFADAIRTAGFTGPRGQNVVEVEFKEASFDGDPLDFSRGRGRRPRFCSRLLCVC